MFLSGENSLAIRFDALHRAFGGGQRSVCSLRSCVGSVGRRVFSAPIPLPLRAKVFCLRIAGEIRGILAEKWGRNRKSSRFFGASSPVFPIATPPLLSWPNFAAHCASSSCRDGLRWTRDGRASFAGTSIGCCGEGKQKRPRSTKIDRGRELERADLAAGTAARRLSVCLCVCRKVR